MSNPHNQEIQIWESIVSFSISLRVPYQENIKIESEWVIRWKLKLNF